MKVLVDTSVWSLAFRRKPKQLNAKESVLTGELVELIHEHRVVMVGPVRQELLSGVKAQRTFERLSRALWAFPDEPLTTQDFEAAARANNRCRAVGVSGAAIDFLLCAVALNRGLAIFSADRDFERYVQQLSFPLHQPRPAN